MKLEPRVYIVGAGPGDPDLITVKGLNILMNADLVLYTDSLVNEQLVSRVGSHAKVLQSSGMDLEQMVDVMAEAVLSGKAWPGCIRATRPYTALSWSRWFC